MNRAGFRCQLLHDAAREKIASGVIVANQTELFDRFESMGADMLRERAGKTSEVAGDGTTASTALAQAIVAEGIEYVSSGMNPADIRRGMDKTVIGTVRALGTLARPCNSSLEIVRRRYLSPYPISDRRIAALGDPCALLYDKYRDLDWRPASAAALLSSGRKPAGIHGEDMQFR